jgi:hypothetical protein
MAAEWYYTANRQQMGPVSWDELQQLATAGLLTRQDLVWTEGMEEWIKADRQDGLFTEAEPASGRRSRADETARRARRRRNDDDDDEDDRESRRRKARQKEGMAVGLKIGLAIGGGVFLLFLLSCGGAWLFLLNGDLPGPGGAKLQTYTVTLAPGALDERWMVLRGGRQSSVTLGLVNVQRQTTVEVAVYNNTNQQLAILNGNLGGNRVMPFTPPVDGQYKVRVQNRGPGRATCSVVINN